MVSAPLDVHSDLWLPAACDTFTSSVLKNLNSLFKDGVEAVCRNKLPSRLLPLGKLILKVVQVTFILAPLARASDFVGGSYIYQGLSAGDQPLGNTTAKVLQWIHSVFSFAREVLRLNRLDQRTHALYEISIFTTRDVPIGQFFVVCLYWTVLSWQETNIA